MVRFTPAVFDGSAALAACTWTVAGEERIAGAVNRPPGEIVPSVALPPITPLTDHSTVVFVVFETVAVRVVVVPSKTVVVTALTLTLTDEPPGESDELAPMAPAHPAVARAAAIARNSSGLPRERLRYGERCASNTAAFECKASASDERAKPQSSVRASRQLVAITNGIQVLSAVGLNE